MNPTDSPHDPVNALTQKEPGAPPADDHGTSGPPSPEVIQRGYEADVYDSKTVLSVPLLVVLFFVLAFGTVTIIFWVIADPKGDPKAHPAATADNQQPLNDRIRQNYRGPKDGTGQPRLEPVKLRSGGDLARAITRPELPVAEGNSPELHPEDLRMTKERFPEFFNTGADKLGVDQAMSLSNDTLKKLFPAQQGGTRPTDSEHAVSAANAGRGMVPPPPKVELPAPAPPPKPKGGKQ